MRAFEALCPSGPPWTVDWTAIQDAFAWVRRLIGVPQDAVHHAEGDVATHTMMAAVALTELDEWRALPPERRVRLFATVLLHDVAKPDCTQHTPEGRITAHGHSRKGDLLARQILWERGVPVAWREHVAALVRHHQVPFWALERPDLERIALNKFFKQRREKINQRLGRRRYANPARERPFAPRHLFAHFFGFAQNPQSVFERDLAGVGQNHTAFGADKKRHAELFFERFHLVADGGLRQVQLFRSLRKIQSLGNRGKSSELPKFHSFNSLQSLDWFITAMKNKSW